MDNKQELLNELKIEDFIWVIYLLIIGLSFISNSYERDYIINNNNNSKKIYRILNIVIFSIAVLIYLYFFIDNYNDSKEIKESDSQAKKKFIYLSFLGTILTLISGLIFLYIAINDKELETEISFN